MQSMLDLLEEPTAPYLTPAQVAEVLSISRLTVYRLVARGSLPCVSVRHSLRIPSRPLLSTPPAAARSHWPPLRRRLERIDRLRQQQHLLETAAVQLREAIPAAKARDARLLGAALSAGEDEPAPEAPGLEAELERAVRNSLAPNSAIAEEITKATKLVERSRGEWAKDLERRLGDAAARYRTQVVAMEEARNHLVEEVWIGAWLSTFPAQGARPQTSLIAGDPELATQHPPRHFTELRDDLLRDSEHLPTVSPVQPSAEYLRMLDKDTLAVQLVDAHGQRRTSLLRRTPTSP